MKPLFKRNALGVPYTVPSTPRRPANGHADAPEPTSPQERKRQAQIGQRRAKLTEANVREARALHAAGKWNVNDLAYIYGVTQSTMSCVVAGKTWRHVTDQPTEPQPREQEL
jgi:hypothetical protein